MQVFWLKTLGTFHYLVNLYTKQKESFKTFVESNI